MKGRRQKRRENVSREEAIIYTVQAMGKGLKAFEEDYVVVEMAKVWKALAVGALIVGFSLLFPKVAIVGGLLLIAAATISIAATIRRQRKSGKD